jgi:hypothetical protein
MPLSADGYCHPLEESAYESKDPSPRVVLEFDELAEYYTDNPFVEKIKSVLSLFNEIEYNLGLQDFLIRNDDLLDILPELQDKIRSTFPDDTVLKVVLQDQMENESPQLVIFLSSQKQPLLSENLYTFYESWYANKMDLIQDRIIVSI